MDEPYRWMAVRFNRATYKSTLEDLEGRRYSSFTLNKTHVLRGKVGKTGKDTS